MENKKLSDLVVQYVMTVPDEEFAGLSVSKLAHRFRLDRYKLSRQFKKQTRMTLDSFLTREKMFRAAFLLIANKDISVKDVSRKVGFCTSDYFIRVFRDYYGIVPGRYKEYKTRRSGIGNRRSILKDRRKRLLKSRIPKSGDRRKGLKDLRNGHKDRRKQNTAQDQTHESENGNGNGNGDSCDDCQYKLSSLENGEQGPGKVRS